MNCDCEKNRSPIELKIVADDATELRAKLESMLGTQRYNNVSLEAQVNLYKRENQMLCAIIDFLDHTNQERVMLGVHASKLLQEIRETRNARKSS
jgi:hypothetical protein